MHSNDTYRYLQDGGADPLVFELREGVFRLTDTSNLLIEACGRGIASPGKTLDLGCGCGLVGITLARKGLCNGPVYASDLSCQAVALARKNAQKLSVAYVARCGSLYEPWKGERFDVIVDDVAGISDDIAQISPWYPEGVSCDAGRDGVGWILRIIEQTRDHVVPGGMLLLPVLSLSNEEKILEALEAVCSSFEVIAKRDWFLPESMAARQDILSPLIEDGSIRCQKKYGKWIWHTHIYKAVF